MQAVETVVLCARRLGELGGRYWTLLWSGEARAQTSSRNQQLVEMALLPEVGLLQAMQMQTWTCCWQVSWTPDKQPGTAGMAQVHSVKCSRWLLLPRDHRRGWSYHGSMCEPVSVLMCVPMWACVCTAA